MNWVWYCIEIGVNLVEFGLYLFLINSKFRNKTNNIIPAVLVHWLLGTAGISFIGFYTCYLVSRICYLNQW